MHSETGEALEDKEISGESGDDGESKSTTHENHDHNDKHETSKTSVNVSLVLVLSITQRQVGRPKYLGDYVLLAEEE